VFISVISINFIDGGHTGLPREIRQPFGTNFILELGLCKEIAEIARRNAQNELVAAQEKRFLLQF
jgi:hypothetical protein